jgi:CO/xanthine dehydrogenase FAD-binding subunit
MDYLAARDLDEAVRLRSQTGYPALAGGTDLYPAIENGVRVDGVIDISRIAALRVPIGLADDVWTIPALTTWSDVIGARLPPQFDALKQAAAEVGGRQIQNTGTVGGNLCNASPAADGVTALLALDASAVVRGSAGERIVPLATFIQGNRRTALQRDEILAAVRVPALRGRHASAFRKLGARCYLVISIVMAAVVVELDPAGVVRTARVAVGACADRSLRITPLEASLAGLRAEALAHFRVADGALGMLAPIDDVRASAPFRAHAAKAILEDAIHDICSGLLA